jgi:DNA-binding beta-propeller fold protein YncE
MKFIFILLLIALTLIFPINVSIAENNNFIKSLTGFQWSMGLSLTSDEIYVVDGLYNKILVFSKSDIEKNISNFTDYKNEYFLNENKCGGHVHGISVVDEKIYTVKNNFDCIAIFDLFGNFVDEFGKTGDKNGEFDGPQNLEIFGEKIFVVDTGNDRIQIFDLSGNFVDKFGKTGDKNGEFDGMTGIEIFGEKIFVVDTGNDRIQIFDLSGNFVDDIKADFKIPHQIVADEDKIYVLDTYNYEIKIFSNSNILNSKNYITQSNDYFEIVVILLIVIFSIIISYKFLRKKFL